MNDLAIIVRNVCAAAAAAHFTALVIGLARCVAFGLRFGF